MATAAEKKIENSESFASLLDETLGTEGTLEGAVLRGTVVDIRNDMVMVDVGLKSEGYIPTKEFTVGNEQLPAIGDEVDVYVERYENRDGEVGLSRERARREEAWVELEKAYAREEKVKGFIFGRVKGGFMVDLSGAVAFLPNSQVDVRPIRDITPLLNIEQPFQILKMDRKRGNIVVSRRAILEESRAEARSDFVATLQEGQTLQGVVKNITDYGAFIDLGGVDGLLHVTDISWKRINHPSEALQVGQQINVQVIKYNPENQRISLGMKQLEQDPWMDIQARFPVGSKHNGEVTNITDYGAFVELSPGIEGLVHVSEMSWVKKNPDPAKVVSTSQQVDVVVLEIDEEKRRISLGIKQCQNNPWESFLQNHPLDSDVETEIKSVTKEGLVLALDGDLEGWIAKENLAWNSNGTTELESYQKGQQVKARILDATADHDRVVLGIKQLSADPFAKLIDTLKKGSIVTCTVSAVQDNGVEVSLGDGLTSFIRRSDLSRDRSEQRPDRFAIGEKVDAMVTSIDKAARKVGVSIKARETAEEKEAMAEYGSTDSGASLGDILGPALKQSSGDNT